MKKSFGFKTLWMSAVFAVAVASESACLRAADQPIRVLIFSGQNNHDWKTTTPKLKSILTDSGRFTVVVTEQPERWTATMLVAYDLVVSDWNAWGDAKVKQWPAGIREAFLDFIRSGKGYVSVHAGSSSFYDWPEYQQIGGLFWNLAATSHGPPHEFTVQCAGEHPVTRGLAPFKTKDELWLRPGVHPAAQVLATADGQPLAVATALDQGRGFALLLGHSAAFMDTPGFQTLLLRGAEWAATRKVTLVGVSDTRVLDPDAVIRSVAGYRFGDDRKAVLALERLVQAASVDPGQRATLAAKLAATLATDVSVEGKRSIAEGLSLLGSASEVLALTQGLADTNLVDLARQALERIPADQSEAALRAALATTVGPARVGLIHSLAARHAERALPEIAKFLTDTDREVVAAAIDALGKFGGAQAVTALQAGESKIVPELRERFSEALLRCAESLQASGQTDEAAAVFAKLVAPSQPAHIRMAAFPPQVAALGERGTEKVLAALTSDDKTMRSAGIRALRSIREPALLRAAVGKLETFPLDLQEAIIALCGERGDVALLSAVTQAAGSADAGVKRAVIKALGLIGDASTVEPLARLSELGSDDERKAIVESIARLRGRTVDSAVLVALKGAPPARQHTLIRALTVREIREATPELLAAIGSPDAGVRREAIHALGRLADALACASMAQLLDSAEESDKGLLQGALMEVCQRDPSAVPVVVNELSKVAPSSKAILVGVLGSVGGAPSLAAVRSQLKSESAEVRIAAVRVLAEWPDAEPLEDLAGVVETTSDSRVRVLAARGMNRMASQAPMRAARAAGALARALASTTDTVEQRSLLSALIGIPSVPSLSAAQAQLKSPALAADAAAGLLQIAEVIYPWHIADVKVALAELRSVGSSPALAQRADSLAAKLEQPANLAVGGFATSPDGLEKDGAANGDQAAIDGDPATYWDEEDNQKLYRLRVQLRERSTVGCLRIMGWTQHNFAPKDFEVLCDDKVVKNITGAQYENNWLTVEFPPVACSAVEMKITSCYGPSPAIREVEIYTKPWSK